MEKINVAELLKDCPNGMELDCAIWDSEAKVFLKRVLNDDFPYPIEVTVKYNNTECTKSFTKYGAYNDLSYCKCVIFPKGKTTWEGFQRLFKDGDIIFTHANCLKVGLGNTWISIFQEKRNGGVATYVDYAENGDGFYSFNEYKGLLCMDEDIMRQRFATEEEKEKLFQAIKNNGYKWNAETKTLEKLIQPKFKIGDKIKPIDSPRCYIIQSIEFDRYILHNNHFIRFKDEHIYELVPDKFDINTLVPFDKVLVRFAKGDVWRATLFSHYDTVVKCGCYHFVTISCKSYPMCIPFEGNERLLGKTYDCDEYFKTWK